MYNLLLKLMLTAALLQFGFSMTEVGNCKTKKCQMRLEKASREVLKIKWRPISVFPEEAGRFK